MKFEEHKPDELEIRMNAVDKALDEYTVVMGAGALPAEEQAHLFEIFHCKIEEIYEERIPSLLKLFKKEAKDLLADPPGTNEEYERGMCELIARVLQSLGLTPNETCVTAKAIGKEIGASWK